ncbi:MAG: hypothetical protein HAW67_01445 [Endozoicomonadaceae bacterium]|nr:hypothetical protein [Endozoicomonadaceae bacterium]
MELENDVENSEAHSINKALWVPIVVILSLIVIVIILVFGSSQNYSNNKPSINGLLDFEVVMDEIVASAHLYKERHKDHPSTFTLNTLQNERLLSSNHIEIIKKKTRCHNLDAIGIELQGSSRMQLLITPEKCDKKKYKTSVSEDGITLYVDYS